MKIHKWIVGLVAAAALAFTATPAQAYGGGWHNHYGRYHRGYWHGGHVYYGGPYYGYYPGYYPYGYYPYPYYGYGPGISISFGGGGWHHH